MFLVRSAFWLSVVVMLLPTGQTPSTDSKKDGQSSVSAVEALNAARTTVGDISGFCSRNPDVCEKGQYAFSLFKQKAKYGAKLIYEWASRDESTPVATSVTRKIGAIAVPVITGSIRSLRIAAAASGTSQNTLTQDDLVPSWGRAKRRSRA